MLRTVQPVESVQSRLARGALPVQLSVGQAARVVENMLAFEVRRRDGHGLWVLHFLFLHAQLCTSQNAPTAALEGNYPLSPSLCPLK
jgi:hypothetical protein